jgi:phenylalanyl-tRNA synthetase alpha chain
MDITEIKKSALTEIEKAKSAEELEKIRIFYLGRQDGKLTAVLRSLKDLPIGKRREIGPKAQALKRELENFLEEKLKKFQVPSSKLQVDLTAPGKRFRRGHLHPLTLVDREIRRIFLSMNFSVVEGPEVETEYYNFDALNIPPNHPAREAWDTFWIKRNPNLRIHPNDPNKKLRGIRINSDFSDRLLLRTHTSPVQIRYMEKHTPPFQIIAPGRCFRYEATDISHETNFYQVEGLMVGKNITLSNFKFVIEEFLKRFFSGQKIEFRYRSGYFPFVEPGVEVDIKFKGKWLEVIPAGMVHPRVFEYAHYNPHDWQGFAFGAGLNRLAMIKYNIPDIRLFNSGDLRFIHQF